MKILVLGVGNILLKDEGIGVHVLEKLRERNALPENVTLQDGGTLGLGLMPMLEEGYDHIIVLDAIKADDVPGSIYRFSLTDLANTPRARISPHEIGLLETLTLANLNDIQFETTIIGIVPDEVKMWGMELSPTLESRLEEIADFAEREIRKIVNGGPGGD